MRYVRFDIPRSKRPDIPIITYEEVDARGLVTRAIWVFPGGRLGVSRLEDLLELGGARVPDMKPDPTRLDRVVEEVNGKWIEGGVFDELWDAAYSALTWIDPSH